MIVLEYVVIDLRTGFGICIPSKRGEGRLILTHKTDDLQILGGMSADGAQYIPESCYPSSGT